MAAPFFSTPFQPYVYQSQQGSVTAFQISGGDVQALQVMLKSQDKLTAKPGTMCYMSGNMQMDNNYLPENDGGVWQWIFGKSVDLANFSGELLCQVSSCLILLENQRTSYTEVSLQADAFLCSVNDVSVTSTVEPRPRNIEIGAEMILKQKLRGQGMAFLVGGGSAMQIGPDGDNQLTASLTGPGVVFIQSLPFPRLSQRIASRSVAGPSLRDNPKFFIQIVMFFFLAYVMIVSSIILTDV
ncbi:hypothetical protein BAE44_0004249 [Dichanthelium oligosanthes]|uniref:Uncharacterized protein n=1 Tax=Dichanthelium oligosanthes TaxID=888268 RepID=A0A1E5WBD8_9POAL|nr:hypothetical protein BAE44_0004249 [Dichanthelium oligosanthes]